MIEVTVSDTEQVANTNGLCKSQWQYQCELEEMIRSVLC